MHTHAQNPVEILAPAGGMDSLIAAVRCGADAVYLGAGEFNARRNAANFDAVQLKEAVDYCHARQVKVYQTLNTLVSDNEIPDLLEVIADACAAGVDAFIVQDLAVARLVRTVSPDIRLHGSTQLAVMSPEGFQVLEELGFVRAVVPRELTLDEVRAIREKTSLELEIFLHGALCMSVSGQCYFSSMLGGRSGNRGLCAQPCRLPASVPGGNGYDLSLKDLDLIPHLPELREAGVLSYKIEGRMKRPEYVAAAVTACRNAADGISDPGLDRKLQAVFSRSGFTDGYLTGNRNATMFGTRQKNDVTAAAPILKDLSHLYDKEVSPTPMDLTFTADLSTPPLLTVSAAGESVSVQAEEPPQAAQNKAADEASVLKHLGKTGGTPFHVEHADIRLGEGLFLPASGLNALRREAVEQLEQKVVEKERKDFLSEKIPAEPERHRANRDLDTFIRLQTVSQYSKTMEKEKLIIPLRTSARNMDKLHDIGVLFGVEIPRGQYEDTDRTVELLKQAKEHHARFAFAGTLDGIALAKKAGLPILGSFTLNAFNSDAIEEYEKLGLTALTVSQELKLTQIEDLAGSLPRGIVSYGRTPLMLTRNMPGGISTKEDVSLKDRKGKELPIHYEHGAADILNALPLYMGDRTHEMRNIDFQLLYFTVESREEIMDILKTYRGKKPFSGEFTRGLYYRGVL